MPGSPPPNSNRASQRQGPAAPALVSVTELNRQSTGSDRRSEGSGPRAVCRRFPFCPYFIFTNNYPAFPGCASRKEPACQGRRCERCGFNSWVGKIPWRRAWQPTPVFLPGDPMDRGPDGPQSMALQESDTTEATSHTLYSNNSPVYSPFIDEETEVRG